jgi:Domain of unknown function (DUF6883)
VRLPNAHQAIMDPRKIRDYLLLPEHPVGRFKAKFFRQLGFARDEWRDLRDHLHSLALQAEAEASERTDYGQKYIVRGTIDGRAGRKAKILTVWIILDGEDVPRFVTAYPES